MMKLDHFVNCHEIDYTKNLVDEITLEKIAGALNVSFGSQMKAYLLKYGYLGYKTVELYGINSRQEMNSDMAKQTLYLHKFFGKTKGFTALEHLGADRYALADYEDDIFLFSSERDEMQRTGIKLEAYICKRFMCEDDE